MLAYFLRTYRKSAINCTNWQIEARNDMQLWRYYNSAWSSPMSSAQRLQGMRDKSLTKRSANKSANNKRNRRIKRCSSGEKGIKQLGPNSRRMQTKKPKRQKNRRAKLTTWTRCGPKIWLNVESKFNLNTFNFHISVGSMCECVSLSLTHSLSISLSLCVCVCILDAWLFVFIISSSSN